MILIFKSITLKRRGGERGSKKPASAFVADSAAEGEQGVVYYQNFCMLPKDCPDVAYYFSCICFYYKTTEKEEWKECQGGEREIKEMRHMNYTILLLLNKQKIFIFTFQVPKFQIPFIVFS